MVDSSSQLYLYSTTVSDVGTVRSNNQDSSFAGEHIAAICDGMGGHAGGDIASTIAIRSLVHIEKIATNTEVDTVAKMMETSFSAAHDAIVGKAHSEHALAGMGTTVTTVSLVKDYWVLAHIGDSRAYLLRDRKLSQMTADHNYVQHLIDTNRITESEAKNHPQRNIVMRVLGDFDMDSHPDIAVLRAGPADRWLLCSDGLCGVLEDSTIETVLNECANSLICAQKLVEMALKAGSTDNVTAVIADASLALNAEEFDIPHQIPTVGGAAGSSLSAIADIINQRVATAPGLHEAADSPALRAAALIKSDVNAEEMSIAIPSQEVEENEALEQADTGEIPIVKPTNGIFSAQNGLALDNASRTNDTLSTSGNNGADTHTLADFDTQTATVVEQPKEYLNQDRTGHKQDNVSVKKREIPNKNTSHYSKMPQKPLKKRVIVSILSFIIVVALAVSGTMFGLWSQSKYFIGLDNHEVSIYQGVHTSVFGFNLYHKVEKTSLLTKDLPQDWIRQLEQGIQADSLPEARKHAKLIEREVRQLHIDNKSVDNTQNNSQDGQVNDQGSQASEQSTNNNQESFNNSHETEGRQLHHALFKQQFTNNNDTRILGTTADWEGITVQQGKTVLQSIYEQQDSGGSQ